ncbi:hypothetical protein [Thalassotalea castellviae]|uniref:DUF1471 domain-containing protein n=1 Tax=Thalassotalea castellviae TaxID=3075612 RepID=A0ABU2ZW98_9GAMM|nr:hypothetical protein [Thalassotalea sp. W431]MDT0602216.1 hypothetical protein [Thalassotalea sp. W431]
MKVLILLVTVILYSSLSFANDVINFPWSGQTYLSTENYFEEVLTLALNKSEDKYGAYIVNKVEAGTSQEHNLRLIQ